jgi:hypothetical protein
MTKGAKLMHALIYSAVFAAGYLIAVGTTYQGNDMLNNAVMTYIAVVSGLVIANYYQQKLMFQIWIRDLHEIISRGMCSAYANTTKEKDMYTDAGMGHLASVCQTCVNANSTLKGNGGYSDLRLKLKRLIKETNVASKHVEQMTLCTRPERLEDLDDLLNEIRNFTPSLRTLITPHTLAPARTFDIRYTSHSDRERSQITAADQHNIEEPENDKA